MFFAVWKQSLKVKSKKHLAISSILPPSLKAATKASLHCFRGLHHLDPGKASSQQPKVSPKPTEFHARWFHIWDIPQLWALQKHEKHNVPNLVGSHKRRCAQCLSHPTLQPKPQSRYWTIQQTEGSWFMCKRNQQPLLMSTKKHFMNTSNSFEHFRINLFWRQTKKNTTKQHFIRNLSLGKFLQTSNAMEFWAFFPGEGSGTPKWLSSKNLSCTYFCFLSSFLVLNISENPGPNDSKNISVNVVNMGLWWILVRRQSWAWCAGWCWSFSWRLFFPETLNLENDNHLFYSMVWESLTKSIHRVTSNRSDLHQFHCAFSDDL